MSPRAACRLASLGFTAVYDYMPGKADWLARGLPVEGHKATAPRAVDFARQDATTCRPDETIGAVRARVAASPYGFALVTTDDRVLLGRLRKAAIDGDPALTAAQAMEPGPSTTRPDTAPERLLARLETAHSTTALLSDPDGRLLGLVRRHDLLAGHPSADRP